MSDHRVIDKGRGHIRRRSEEGKYEEDKGCEDSHTTS